MDDGDFSGDTRREERRALLPDPIESSPTGEEVVRGKCAAWGGRVCSPTVLLCFFTWINMLTYFDRGAIAAVITKIGEDHRIGTKGYVDLTCHKNPFNYTETPDNSTASQYALTKSQEGTIGSAFILGFMLFCPLFANMASFVNPLLCITIGELIWVAATLASAISMNYWFLVFARCLVGAGEASFAGLAPAIIDDSSTSANRTLRLGVFYAMIPVGTAMGYGLGSVIASADVNLDWLGLGSVDTGWRLVFVLESLAMAPFAFIVLITPRHYLNPREEVGLCDVMTPSVVPHPAFDSLSEAPLDTARSSTSFAGALSARGHRDPTTLHSPLIDTPAYIPSKRDAQRLSGISRSSVISVKPIPAPVLDDPPLDVTDTADHSVCSLVRKRSKSLGSASRSTLGTVEDAAVACVDPLHVPPEPEITWNVLSAATALLQNHIWLTISYGYSVYTFVLGGIAFFASNYGVEIHVGLSTGNLLFGGITALTGTFGTAFGGSALDWLGGSAGPRGLYRCAKWMVISAAIATPMMIATFLVSIPLTHNPHASATFKAIPYVFITFAEFILFSATAPLNASLLACVPPSLRAYAMGFNVFLIHLLGDFPSPLIIGVIADDLCSVTTALMIASGYMAFCVLSWAGTWYFAHRHLILFQRRSIAVMGPSLDHVPPGTSGL